MGVFRLNVARSIVPPLRVVMECRSCHVFLELRRFRTMRFTCRSCEKLAGAERVLADSTQPGDGPAISSESSAILQQSVKNSQHQSYLFPQPAVKPPCTDRVNSKPTSLDHFFERTLHRPRSINGKSVVDTVYTNQEKSRDD
jgi:hypothetical protein